VTKSFDGQPVLQGVDLEVVAGEVAAVSGPSGSGKTTLLRVISGDEPADLGTVRMQGRVVADEYTDLPPKRRPIAWIHQAVELDHKHLVGTNIALGLPRSERRRPSGAARVAQMFDLVGLPTPVADRKPSELSTSERQRVALARALVAAPAILLLDEPFSTFDPATRRRLRTELGDILRAAGVATVLVSHHASDLSELADHLWYLQDGRLIGPST
jgi:iron(III) transport system ATP-binding protein